MNIATRLIIQSALVMKLLSKSMELHRKKSFTLTVSPEGTVTVPGYGPIYVSGMSVDRANAKSVQLLALVIAVAR